MSLEKNEIVTAKTQCLLGLIKPNVLVNSARINDSSCSKLSLIPMIHMTSWATEFLGRLVKNKLIHFKSEVFVFLCVSSFVALRFATFNDPRQSGFSCSLNSIFIFARKNRFFFEHLES